MTQDEVIKLAAEAGFKWQDICETTIEQRLERFANLVVAAEREKCTNTREFVTLPREVAERALKSMLDARCSVYDGFEYDKAATALAAAMEQTPAMEQPQSEQPAMTPIAQRKLDSLLAEGYTISGYSVYH